MRFWLIECLNSIAEIFVKETSKNRAKNSHIGINLAQILLLKN
jgi:hypothetical protein